MDEIGQKAKRSRGRPRLENPRRSENTAHITLTDVERAELEAAARAEDKKPNALARDLYLAGMKQRKASKLQAAN